MITSENILSIISFLKIKPANNFALKAISLFCSISKGAFSITFTPVSYTHLAEGKGWISLKYTTKIQSIVPAPVLTTDQRLTEWIAKHHLMDGSKGELVEGVQAFLVANNADIEIDGIFKAKTDAAVKAYQLSLIHILMNLTLKQRSPNYREIKSPFRKALNMA